MWFAIAYFSLILIMGLISNLLRSATRNLSDAADYVDVAEEHLRIAKEIHADASSSLEKARLILAECENTEKMTAKNHERSLQLLADAKESKELLCPTR